MVPYEKWKLGFLELIVILKSIKLTVCTGECLLFGHFLYPPPSPFLKTSFMDGPLYMKALLYGNLILRMAVLTDPAADSCISNICKWRFKVEKMAD